MVHLEPATRHAASSGPGRPKDLEKRQAILNAAKHLFTEQNYVSVSMDDIASSAGVSKLTVYSHFGDKENLFTEAIRQQCQEVMPDDLFSYRGPGPLRDQLHSIGRAFFAMITTPQAIATYRVMVSPGNAEDSIVRKIIWEAGPKHNIEILANFLRIYVEQGVLNITDLSLAAWQFLSLIKGELHVMMLCDVCPNPSQDDIDHHVNATINFFLSAYGVDA